MSETEDMMTDASAVEDAAEEAASAPEAPASSMDLSTRPDGEWLNEVEGEINDVDIVLKCLARDSATICTQCNELTSVNMLDGRPVLARCASTKQPR